MSRFTVLGSVFGVCAAIGYTYPPFVALKTAYEPVLPAHDDSAGRRLHAKLIETEMSNLSIVRRLNKDSGFESIQNGTHVYTNSTLQVPGGINVAPRVYRSKESGETVAVYHVGYKVTGFPFIVHGGILATLLHETFSTDAEAGWKIKNLDIKYRAPSLANQFLVVRSHKKKDGSVEGSVQNAHGKVLVEASADFICQ